jgi:hypothetical protein
MRQIMDFYRIIEAVNEAILKERILEIYYPKTENSEEGWRKILPKNVTTDIPPDGETLVVGKDRLSPGHILNAYDDKKSKELKSFILGKIKQARVVK